MFIVTPRRIADALITTAGAAELLYTLADLAIGGSQSKPAASYYGNIPSGPGQGQAVNCVILRPATVDIRVEIGIVPTSLRGTLIPAGTTYPIVADPSQLYIISTGVDTAIDVTYCIVAPGEIPSAPATGINVALAPVQDAAATTSSNSSFAATDVVASALAANPNRNYANFRNAGANPVRISSDNAMVYAVANGALILPGSNVNWPTVEEVFCICSAGTATTLDIIDFSN